MNIPAEAGTPDEKIAVCPPLFLLIIDHRLLTNRKIDEFRSRNFLLIIGLRSRLSAPCPAGVYPSFQPLSVVSGIF